jgi:hypothetical protein
MTAETRKTIWIFVLELTGIAVVGWYLMTYQIDNLASFFQTLFAWLGIRPA